MKSELTSTNKIRLLENGEEFFPAVFDAISKAQHRVLIETFIVFEDKVGNKLHETLITAASRGVHIDLTVDGYGSADLSSTYIEGLTAAGIRFHIYDPQPRRFGFRTNLFYRMHRKIVVVDDAIAFVGGINYSADHLGDFGATAKQDYAVSIQGPAVAQIRQFAQETLRPQRPQRTWRRLIWPQHHPPASGAVALVVRDNDAHRNDIELHYRVGIRSAKKDITIANAYFFPGYRFLRDLRRAAKRGVNVRLILQGEPDMPAARFVATMLYDYLISAGVEIHEYCERPFHGKVAVVDDTWSTVGSSNLDPLSLALNLEANVMIYDNDFSTLLKTHLDTLIRDHCSVIERTPRPARKIQRVIVSTIIFHFLRRFPAWARHLPRRHATLTSAPTSEPAPLSVKSVSEEES